MIDIDTYHSFCRQRITCTVSLWYFDCLERGLSDYSIFEHWRHPLGWTVFLFVVVWLSVPVQSIAWKDPSPKWPKNHLYMPKAYTVFVQNHFFWNNSGKSEPIGRKFNKKIGLRGTPPANVWRSLPNKREMASKKTHFAQFLPCDCM